MSALRRVKRACSSTIDRGWLGPLSLVSRRATSSQLRVLGYHGIDDPEAFASQMQRLVEYYTPVSGAEVAAAVRGERPLPDRPVWVTFDDGYVSVVDHGAALLAQLGIVATIFVCPGLIEGRVPQWWDIAEAGFDRGGARLVPGDPHTPPMTRLKALPDDDRRDVVNALGQLLTEAELRSLADRVADMEALNRWRDAGHELGNHTWDHPILPRTTGDEPEEQVQRAHDWLVARELMPTERLFAYPNGDRDTRVQPLVAELGYGAALLFDQRLAARALRTSEISRLRIHSDSSLARFDFQVSGAYSALARLRRLPSFYRRPRVGSTGSKLSGNL